MCGHVGIAGKLTLRDEATLKRLLMFDYFRGPDSTGLGTLFTDGDVKVAKIASNPVNLFDTTRFKAALNAYKASVLGETRARVAVEAAVQDSWDRYLGLDGRFIGMHDFGASGKIEDVYKKFDITTEAVVRAGRAVVEAVGTVNG